MAVFSLQALHDEIENDPESIGYKVGGFWKSDSEIKALINAINLKIDRTFVGQREVRKTTTFDAYDTLSIDEQEWLRWMTPGDGEFDVTADMKLKLTGRTIAANGVAGSGNDSNSHWSAAHRGDMAPAMLAIIEVDGSRAEVLWGEGTSPSTGQIGAAANL